MRLLLPTLLTVVLLFSQAGLSPTASAAVGVQGLYYISDGQSLTEVRSDPEQVQADRWAAFYFRKGTSGPDASQRWGLEIQTSPAEVMKSVVTSQEFERAYAKWCGCEWGSNTFFNVIAPVALTKSSPALSAGKAEIIIKAQNIRDRIEQIVKTLNGESELVAEKKVLPEYVENIHKALDQYATLNNVISLLSDNAVANIEKRLNQLADEVSNIERASLVTIQPISNASSSRSFTEVSYPIETATINGGKSVSTDSATGTANTAPQPSTSTKPKKDDGRKVYTIQVGVFTSESRAEAVMSQLKKRQYDAVFIDAIPGGTGPYHVRVGRLPDMQAAQNLRKRLAGDGFDTFITVDLTGR
jgi:cell division septation protein DedD